MPRIDKRIRLKEKTHVVTTIITVSSKTSIIRQGPPCTKETEIEAIMLTGGIQTMEVPVCLSDLLQSGVVYQVQVSYGLDDPPSPYEFDSEGVCCTLLAVIQILGSCEGFKDMITTYDEYLDRVAEIQRDDGLLRCPGCPGCE